MGKKKPFIDKNNSSTYHLLHRSQRDVGGDGGGGVVLWPSPNNNQATNEKVLKGEDTDVALDAWKEDLNEAGLVDEYDYEKHMKPITGSGDFFSSEDCKRANALMDPRAHIYEDVDDDVKEVDRQLDSIALTADCMDEDIAQALFGDFEDGNFEEILDDFCVTAAQEPAGENVEEFDYDSHIKQLLENAKKRKDDNLEVTKTENHEWGRGDKEFFSNLKPLHERLDDMEGENGETPLENVGVVSSLSPGEERALCEKFEQTLLEYDSDEVGELNDSDDSIRGDRPLEGNRQVEAALDEYLFEKQDEIFIEGTRHLPEYQRSGGSAFHTLKQGVEAEPDNIKEVLIEAEDFLRGPEQGVPPEEILIDGKSYFSERSRNPWDVESVLSTYSNFDNNPVTIDGGRRRVKKKKKIPTEETVPEESEPVQIQLSNKTGLPLGVFPSRHKVEDFDFDTIASVNKGEKRNKKETKAEKKCRKQQVKQERLMARIQKKMMKEAFSEEFMKAERDGNELTGKTVFRL
mmetsp:Transcript_29546/g.44763  ORF Transcript_29546/g.44763 Transcript_29546/m.44763 type:complete len:518 (-) Transcript_29546:60-1613(-)|eukprot:CAMPEP_0178906288 /NCGR_PEP_ID=MMETSP0786-20121207/6739_1 /TAXON_ID=186022 /ORGANISM="Thalassionema frauenfeldii, Strain CCMP 1798" /LENGTH=517 /DNA_ID=CAMNT_0020577973 /DNA_START=87 /DNA_END=1640 /DNA_ORIENTATION=-